jgi:hypothetical protein
MSTTSMPVHVASALTSASTGFCPDLADPSKRAVGPPGRPVSNRCSPAQTARTVIVGFAAAWGGTICG